MLTFIWVNVKADYHHVEAPECTSIHPAIVTRCWEAGEDASIQPNGAILRLSAPLRALRFVGHTRLCS